MCGHRAVALLHAGGRNGHSPYSDGSPTGVQFCKGTSSQCAVLALHFGRNSRHRYRCFRHSCRIGREPCRAFGATASPFAHLAALGPRLWRFASVKAQGSPLNCRLQAGVWAFGLYRVARGFGVGQSAYALGCHCMTHHGKWIIRMVNLGLTTGHITQPQTAEVPDPAAQE